MKKRIASILMATALTLSLGLGLTGCQQDSGKTIVFADVGWDSVKFHNAVAGFIAESAYGYTWSEVSGSTPIMHEAIVSGEVDVNMEAWTDNILTYERDLSNGDFVELGTNFGDNIQGIYVPRYVIEGDPDRGIAPMAPDLKSVQDLSRYADLFQDPEYPTKGRIYGAIPGWEINEIMRRKVSYNGLDQHYNFFQPGSDAALSAAFTSAYEKGQPIVGYYWEPTWLTGKYDLVLLEDYPYTDAASFEAGRTACPSVDVTVVASNQFWGKNKEFSGFLSQYQTSSSLTSEALAHMQDTGANYADTAKWFLTQHPELLSQWLEPEQISAVKVALGLETEASNWLFDFPTLLSVDVAAFDQSVKAFANQYSAFFDGITAGLNLLIALVGGLLGLIPWWLLLLLVGWAGYKTSGKIRVGVVYLLLLGLVGALGLWDLTLETMSIVVVSVLISLCIGFPTGILIAGSNRANRIMRPVLDTMQTMPVFVYLIPALLFFGLGKAPAVIATTIYAVVPMIRMTNHGIRQVDREVVEAANSFGSTRWQALLKVQIPQAMPTILAGVNQTLMMAMAMVVTCSMIGASGLGMEVLISVNRIEIGRGLIAGFSVVVVAILLDRITQGTIKKEDRHER